MSNSLDADQDRHSVGPDLYPSCLQRLSTDDNSLLARKEFMSNCVLQQQRLWQDCAKDKGSGETVLTTKVLARLC